MQQRLRQVVTGIAAAAAGGAATVGGRHVFSVLPYRSASALVFSDRITAAACCDAALL